MSNLSICRTCLSFSTRLYDLRSAQIQDIFEKLTNKRLKEDSMTAICYICYAQLQRCLKFSEMSWKAEVVLIELISKGIEITQETISRLNRRTSTFSVTPIDYFYNGSTDNALQPFSTDQVEVKVEKVEMEEQTLTEDDFEELVLKEEPVYIEEEIITEELEVWFEKDIDVESEVTLNENCDVKSEIFEEYVDIEGLDINTNEHINELAKNDKEVPKHTSLTYLTNKQWSLNCNDSSKVRTTVQKLKYNIETHTEKKRFICDMCRKTFQSKDSITQHIKTHGYKLYTCLLCNKKFHREWSLREHIKIHTKEKPYICDKCGKTFTDKSSFNRHSQTHTGVKLNSCHLCSKKFYRKSYLEQHMRIHTGQKPFACSICKKSFAQTCALKGHMRIHTGEKTHYCGICSKGFYRKGHLNQHMVVHSATSPGYRRRQAGARQPGANFKGREIQA